MSKSKPQTVLTKAILWKLFLQAYQIRNGKHFVQTPDTLENMAPLIEYFTRDPKFLQRERLVRHIDNQPLLAGFQKGLLIVGAYGNGKTSCMEALQLVFSHYRLPMRFSGYKAHDLVSEYERIGADPTFGESSKYQFYQRLILPKSLYIDDVKKEREAYNYGKVNLIRDILEKRYDHKGSVTHITCNYRDGDTNNDVEDALSDFGEKYGGHIYDRLFAMFNILEFKGKTFRR